MNTVTTLASNLPLIIDVVLGIAVVVLIVTVVSLHRKLKRFLIGIDSKNISDSLSSVSADLGELKSFRDELEKYLTDVEKRLRKSIQAVHTIRFNPWHGTGEGGSQSFATAFMNEDGDGVVISSLYSRDHVSVFGKPLKKRSSPHELSEEEKKAVDEAAGSLGN
jgi:hypothetical protein